jgi:tRNA nucleotidyltransferase/poly(A) polymerase
MYRIAPKADERALRNGHLRLGGRPGSREPFADLSAFKFTHPGEQNAIFSADVARDLGFRDFACNAVYYDPINHVYIDPSGVGITDAEHRRDLLQYSTNNIVDDTT